MKTYMQKALTFIQDEEGASAVEYALLVAMIAIVVGAAVTTFGGKITDLFTRVGGKLDEVGT